MAKSEQSKTSSPLKKIAIFGVVLVTLLATISSVIFFYLYQKELKKSIKPEDEAVTITKEIGKYMDLPLDETPTIATVQDKTKLQDQPLFNKAENGDKVIIYAKAKKAILYRPSTKKIIDVVPINTVTPQPTSAVVSPTQNNATGSATQPSPTQTAINAILLNGTDKVGLTNKIESTLSQSFQNVTVVDKDNAGTRDYEKTILVVLNASIKAEAEKIAASLGAEIQSLPQDENITSKADIVIIVGKDKI